MAKMAYSLGTWSYNWNLSLKLVLISTGVVAMALALKVSAPVVSDFVVSEIPSVWSFLLSWLRPPYLYILINCIIISIFASSKLQTRPEDPAPEMLAVPPTPTPVKDVPEDYLAYGNGVVLGGYGYDAVKAAVSEVRVVDSETVEKTPSDEMLMLMNGGDEAVLSRSPSAWTGGLQKQDSSELLFSYNEKENEKPPVSTRFAHRKPVKASPEGKVLGVSKPKRQETLECTWKTITEGRSMPLTRHLKKSDTWESHGRRNNDQSNDDNTPPPKMSNSETFPDRNSGNWSPGSGRLRKEPSLSQDELNRRVEAFIKKFNHEMRLQRQESLNQYHEMISRGAH